MKKEIVEINGVKFEVDLSTAKVINEYKIGDRVNVLVSEYEEKKVYPGVILSFDNFTDTPTITIAYLKLEYAGASIVFVYFNSASKSIRIAPCGTSVVSFKKSSVVDALDKEITKAEIALQDLQHKKEFFLTNFNKHFEITAPV